jgi:hypothetical protein
VSSSDVQFNLVRTFRTTVCQSGHVELHRHGENGGGSDTTGRAGHNRAQRRDAGIVGTTSTAGELAAVADTGRAPFWVWKHS